MDELRQLPRWQVKREAKVWLPGAREASPCIIEDINLKGVRVSFDKPLLQEEPIHLSLSLEENSEFIKFEALLPWSRKENGRYIYGMCFTQMKEWDKDKIDHFIVDHCSEQFKDKWWAND